MKKFLLIDGMSTAYRAFYAIRGLTTSRGQPTNAVYGFIRMLKKILKEFRLEGADSINVGDEIKADVFAEGDRVDVTGVSKGKGFAGAMKRHGFHGGPKSHGQSDRQRSPGSSGSGTTPGRVYKGKRRPGHMGDVQVTSSHIRIAMVDPERNLIAVQGSVPGAKGGTVVIKEARKQ